MATLTIRNLPNEVVERLKEAAKRKGKSMEQEVRELLENRYRSRREILEQVEQRWKDLDSPEAEEVETWLEEGRD